MEQYFYMGLVGALAALVPLALIATRNELRTVRSRIVEELRSTLFRDSPDLPQLQLAAARYRDTPDSIGGDRDAQDERSRKARQGRVKLWTGALFYFLVCVGGFLILFFPRAALLSEDPSGIRLAPALFWTTEAAGPDALAQVVAVAGAAFLGGYVFQLRHLIRATLNQELGALAFVRASLHVVQGVVTAVVAYRALGDLFGLDIDTPRRAGVAFGAAFLIGYWPDLGLMKIAKGLRFPAKVLDEQALRVAKIVPLEVIDGIDSETAFRLQECNLYDVQNLAAADPIELFAETPYMLLQIFDWVLQAQLCSNVGTAAFAALKRHGIRTIFDLERAALPSGVPDAYLSALGCILLENADPCFRARFILSSPRSDLQADQTDEEAAEIVSPELVRHVVAIMADDLHIQRIRSLWRTMLKTTSDESQPTWLYPTAPLPGEPAAPPRPDGTRRGGAQRARR